MSAAVGMGPEAIIPVTVSFHWHRLETNAKLQWDAKETAYAMVSNPWILGPCYPCPDDPNSTPLACGTSKGKSRLLSQQQSNWTKPRMSWMLDKTLAYVTFETSQPGLMVWNYTNIQLALNQSVTHSVACTALLNIARTWRSLALEWKEKQQSTIEQHTYSLVTLKRGFWDPHRCWRL